MKFQNKTILVTGAAGFIGFYLCKNLIETNDNSINIIGIDNLNDYYDVSLKEARLEILHSMTADNNNGNFIFIKGSIEDKPLIDEVFSNYKPNIVVNLAAQAGVRYSITNPEAYINSNIVGFFNIVEACRTLMKNDTNNFEHLVYASSSSVYGTNSKIPYSVEDKVDNPVSLYAATKKSNELIAHAYSKLYDIPTTGLRFFTVYGPMGRPDMAYFGFANRLCKGEDIQIYNNGDMYRDFTYIDDIITGVVNIMNKVPDITKDGVRYKVYNIGNSKPEKLLYFVKTLENCLINEGVIRESGKKVFLPMQPGDVYQTYADVSDLMQDFNFKPSTNLADGLRAFAKWYKDYYHI